MRIVKISRVLVLAILLVQVAVGQDKQAPAQPNGSGASSGAAPMLVIESLTHDFGEVKSGAPLRYAFKIKNEGKADLLINNVAPG